jgi:hypothetical protein
MGLSYPKNPADRNDHLRALAKGEVCQVRLREVCRHDPDYTVWAHTNTLADQKGMGYKGHDSAGMFACDRCHEVIDRRLLPPDAIDEIVRMAQERTRVRLEAIACALTERASRVSAARWALHQIEGRELAKKPDGGASYEQPGYQRDDGPGQIVRRLASSREVRPANDRDLPEVPHESPAA